MKKAVIMAGGFGTRLRPLTMNMPKPMVPVLNKPMIEHIIDLLKKHNFKDFLSVLYFQPEIITSHFEDGSNFGINMKYVLANADYGTAGAVRNAGEHLDDQCIIISGDVLTNFDISKAMEFHKKREAKATILLTRVPKPLQFGIVIADENGKIKRFLEKPSWGQVFSDTINTGIYILEPEVVDMIPYQMEYDFSKDLFPRMLKEGLPLYGYIADGYWRDIGNLHEYQKGQTDALSNKVSLLVNGIEKDGYTIGENSKVAPNAKFEGKNVIGDNTVIGDHCEIKNSVIGNNVKIGMGVKLIGVTIWNDVEIGDFSEITETVICNRCIIGSSVSISDYVFISDDCVIGNKVEILPNIKLWPNKHVEEGATLTFSLIQEEKWQKELFTGARISGVANIEINPEFGAKLGAALGMTFGKNTTLLASRGPDRVSRIMKRAIEAGLSSVGVKVNDLQAISIPQTRQEIRTGKYAGGLHLRRSPRHKNYTDIIIFNKEGRDIPISVTKKIERYFFGEDITRVSQEEVGTITYPERTNEIYINRFLESLDVEQIRRRQFKILMDYSYGLASSIFPFILGKLNAEALSLHDYVDASRYRPNITSKEPDDDEAIRIMRSLGYELGFTIEPGAEKLTLIDERGVWYSPMRLLSVITKLFLETHRDKEPYKIAVSIVASNEIDQIAKDYNVEVVRIKSSHSDMMEATRDEEVLFVGGIWGGYIFSDFLFASDGMYSVGKILEMLAKTGKTISEIDESIPRRFQHQINVDCPWQFRGQVMRQAMEYSENLVRELVEGVKVFHDDDSVLMMPDHEKGIFWVIAESSKYEDAMSLAKKYGALVAQWQQSS